VSDEARVVGKLEPVSPLPGVAVRQCKCKLSAVLVSPTWTLAIDGLTERVFFLEILAWYVIVGRRLANDRSKLASVPCRVVDDFSWRSTWCQEDSLI
jgi:hypothetical protein